MANDYFNHGDLPPHTRARTSDINTALQLVTQGFNKLPSEQDIKTGRVSWATDTGTPNVYVVSVPAAPSSYLDGMLVEFVATNSNTDASTLNVNNLGAVAIKKADGSDLVLGDIQQNFVVSVRYIGTHFVFLSSTAGDLNASQTARDAALAAQVAAEAAQSNAEAQVALAAAQVALAEAEKVAAQAARVAAEAAAAGVNLPSIVGGDAGKVLVIKQDETGYETGVVNATDEAFFLGY